MFKPDHQPQRKPTPLNQEIPKGEEGYNVPSTQSIIEQLRKGFLRKIAAPKPKKESLPNPPVDEKNQFEIEFPE